MVKKDEYFQAGKPSKDGVKIEYARVVAFNDNNEPLLQFMGETTVSPKVYPRMRHYDDPKLNDRVRLIDGIIDGTWTSA